jgi:hypothetical protein
MIDRKTGVYRVEATEEATDDRESSTLIERPPALDRTHAAIDRTQGLILFFRTFTYCTDFSFLVLVVLGF